MAMTMHVDVVSIEASLFSGRVERVVAPAEMGEVGIYPGHAPLLARLKPGVVRLKIPHQAQENIVYVSGGMLEVQPGGVTILADIAIREKDLEEGTLEDERRKAEETMQNRVTAAEYARLEVELTKAMMSLQGIQRLRHGKKGF
ncbi:MAG TPA: F0F1 ATP synthase subunit epsilon [Thiobacillus sp.]|nr:MAG: F0F1 ATP synthase subunit epsilon [Hydrogenophilales bacterium 16-64-40]OZA31707.1 MAG: F0F1 ATP synthase subunit epsilon [Hydrogenophilales bacterium 17-64-65]HQS83191.1 F0F1 ATP synthase subunit epsilon [Thiobacillus sp.]HQT34134.1 F0F1 ATP synthase subunit epsilon [Thiobacillus sp.]